jgi:hypothetical protein
MSELTAAAKPILFCKIRIWEGRGRVQSLPLAFGVLSGFSTCFDARTRPQLSSPHLEQLT